MVGQTKIIEISIKEVTKLEKLDEYIYKKRATIMKRFRAWESLRKEREKRLTKEQKKQILVYDPKAKLLDDQIAHILIEHVLEEMLAEQQERRMLNNLLKKFRFKYLDRYFLYTLLCVRLLLFPFRYFNFLIQFRIFFFNGF